MESSDVLALAVKWPKMITVKATPLRHSRSTLSKEGVHITAYADKPVALKTKD